jgi:lactate dehydrogenase-like 2-hydroxyacid dehydrogenase
MSVARTLLMQAPFAALAPAFAPFGAVDKYWEITDFPAYVAEHGANVRALIAVGTEGVAKDVLDALPGVGLIACGGTGVDGIDLNDAARRGIKIANTAGLNAEDVADLAMGLLLAVWRQILAGDTMIRTDNWTNRWPPMPPPRSMKGMTLGIMGLGAIGMGIAVRAEAFGMKVIWTGRSPRPSEPRPYVSSVLELAKQSDAMVLAAPLTADTTGVVNAEVLAALGSEGILINIARGQVVDEDALIAALRAGTIRGAGLDVFNEEPTPAGRWADVPRCVLTPHIAGATRDALQAIPGMVLENVRRFYAGEPLASEVKP